MIERGSEQRRAPSSLKWGKGLWALRATLSQPEATGSQLSMCASVSEVHASTLEVHPRSLQVLQDIASSQLSASAQNRAKAQLEAQNAEILRYGWASSAVL